LHFVLHGTAEFDVANGSEKALHRCAVHEAGHAAIALVDSAGEDIPDYTAIGTSHDFEGVTTHSYGYRMDDDLDHSKVLHKVRNCLGGRAAEELVFGVMGIGTRNNSDDLRTVSDLVLEMYLECGMTSDFSDPNTSTDHLLVANGEPSEHQLQRAENATRAFIAEQYRAVMQMLANNRGLLDAITDELLGKRLLEAEDFARLWQVQCTVAEPTNLK
jgi:cell division protease FtsH